VGDVRGGETIADGGGEVATVAAKDSDGHCLNCIQSSAVVIFSVVVIFVIAMSEPRRL
jgi:hypothetical protein